MPTDLEHQLPRFAEALDREAPAISVDEILRRGVVGVEVDLVERPWSKRAPRVNGVPWTEVPLDHDGNGDRVVPMELAPTAAEPPARRRVSLTIALAAAAAVVLVLALASIVRMGDE